MYHLLLGSLFLPVRSSLCSDIVPHGGVRRGCRVLTKSKTRGLLDVSRMMCATSNACATLCDLYLPSEKHHHHHHHHNTRRNAKNGKTFHVNRHNQHRQGQAFCVLETEPTNSRNTQQDMERKRNDIKSIR